MFILLIAHSKSNSKKYIVFYTCYKNQRFYFNVHKFICQIEESVFGMFLREKLTLLYLSVYDFSLHFNYLTNNSFVCIF